MRGDMNSIGRLRIRGCRHDDSCPKAAPLSME